MPDISNPKKVAATRGYGANVIFSGSTAPEREAMAAKVIAETGARLVPPYDHPDIMLGQGRAAHPVLIPCLHLLTRIICVQEHWASSCKTNLPN
jgi:threonine dehydratase